VPPTPTPIERFSAVINFLFMAVDSHRIGNQGGWIPVPLMILIQMRFYHIRHRFRCLAERILAGRIYRRTPSARRRSGGPQPGRKNPLPTRSLWLTRLIRMEAAAAAWQVRSLLADPEMTALMAAAPGPMWRAIRPLCWMLGVEKPAILVRPKVTPPRDPPSGPPSGPPAAPALAAAPPPPKAPPPKTPRPKPAQRQQPPSPAPSLPTQKPKNPA